MRKVGLAVAIACVCAAILFVCPPVVSEVQLYDALPLAIDVRGDGGVLQVYWRDHGDWNEAASQRKTLEEGHTKVRVYLPRTTREIRLDWENADGDGVWTISDIAVQAGGQQIDLRNAFQAGEPHDLAIRDDSASGGPYRVVARGPDPHCIVRISEGLSALDPAIAARTHVMDGLAKTGVVASVFVFTWAAPAVVAWFSLLWQSRKLIVGLARNDFKSRFAGSTLGVVWAFVQPIITITVYCFVFQFGFRAQPTTDGMPYVLWLVSGMIPWLFLSESWATSGNALLEYKYLVQKVVFPVEALPAVKILASLALHAIFLVLTALLFALFGVMPTLRWLELLLYLIAFLALLLGLAALSAALTPLWRDVGQVIAILIQLGFWITPIAWELESTVRSPWLRMLFCANPMHFIVSGYRNCLLGGTYFFQRPESLYFACVVALALACGAWTFRRLKPHFADVL